MAQASRRRLGSRVSRIENFILEAATYVLNSPRLTTSTMRIIRDNHSNHGTLRGRGHSCPQLIFKALYS